MNTKAVRVFTISLITLTVWLGACFPAWNWPEGCVRGQSPLSTQVVDQIEFRVLPGLEVVPASTAGLSHWPVVCDWDDSGRLVVVESGGVGWPIEEHNQKLLHRVVRLSDEDGDGVFDTRVVAADKLPFAEGVLCLGDDLLVGAPPYIWKLTDGDGDGVCEQREIWFDGQTITHCANDIHGPYLGPDGWVYWCKGAFGDQSHELLSGKQLVDNAAHIFRRRIEGGLIEPVISGGMDNPVELGWLPSGDLFFTSTFLQHPADGKRDGIGHAVYGSVFGKDHSALDKVMRTGPLMPIMTHLGPAAPSGLLRLHDQSILGANSDATSPGTLISAQFNLHRIQSHSLQPTDESSYQTDDVVLFETERVDFHPTDVIEDPDGSLIVLDTGGWYDLCCPTSRVDQKIAQGGIYRIRVAGSATGTQSTPVQWEKASVDHCMRLIHDHREWVRRSAKLRLKSMPGAVAALSNKISEDWQGDSKKLHEALSALSFIGTAAALEVIAAFLDHADESLVSAACTLVSTHRYSGAQTSLEELLASPSSQLVRKAVEAIGRIGDPSAVDVLISVPARGPILEHSLIYALIEIDERDRLHHFLIRGSDLQKRRALVALDALKEPKIRDAVFAMALSSTGELRSKVFETLRSHRDWSQTGWSLLTELDDQDPDKWQLIAAWRQAPEVQAYTASRMASDRPHAEQLLQRLVIWSGQLCPPAFVPVLTNWVKKSPETVAPLLSQLKLDGPDASSLVDALHRALEQSESVSAATVRQFVAALPNPGSINNPQLVDALLVARDYASLSKLKIDPSAAERLMSDLPAVAAGELPFLLKAVSNVGRDELDSRMLDALRSQAAARMLNESFLENLYRKRSAELLSQARDVNRYLHQPPADVRLAVEKTLGRLPTGDPVRGLQVFRNSRTACSACHQMGYIGGHVGPELTRIGQTRTREALLESILFPSARIEQGYRPVSVLTDDDRVVNGLPLPYDNPGLKLQLTADKTEILSADNIVQQKPSEISIMPNGLEQQLSLQELADLLALLEQAK